MTGGVAEVWARATAEQPLPSTTTVLLLGALALGLVGHRRTWPVVRLGTTVVHEAGHALVAVLARRRLAGVRLHRDASGVTVSHGPPRGPGVVALLAAGYPAPALLGLTAAALLAAGRGLAVLWLVLALLLALLAWVRNAFGLLVVLVGAAGVLAATWWLPPAGQAGAALLLTWTALLAAPRATVPVLRRPPPGSDPARLARLSPLPARAWSALLLAACLACLVGGAWLVLGAAPGRPGWLP